METGESHKKSGSDICSDTCSKTFGSTFDIVLESDESSPVADTTPCPTHGTEPGKLEVRLGQRG
ncbi:hypothetical protein AKJ39_03770 [candidate division MSBL1 archaeon SCGC-AAA259J03]|uniref:Uncharacterized protein n=1 Tax=candidate division MSBL1 archaeon SCGC-AAA259J03 TaxID=1698269 RepID=A0A656YX94_9EURY|nr:hypothetical protein AKJ39_03770 [candidate division MSBL1 archaeon SCGC-AAA259J03]